MSMPLEHTGKAMVCKAPYGTYRHPVLPKSKGAHTAQALVEGTALAPGTHWQHWSATCGPRLAVMGPGTVPKQLLPPHGTLASPTRPGSSLGGCLGKAKDAD